MFDLLLDDCRGEIAQHKFEAFYRHTITSDRIGAHTATDHTVPYGTALWGWRCPRHFVPGYGRIVPPGHFATAFGQGQDTERG